MEKKIYKIAVIGGDGIGPEVLAEGIKVLNRTGPLLLISPIFPGAASITWNTGK